MNYVVERNLTAQIDKASSENTEEVQVVPYAYREAKAAWILWPVVCDN